MQQNKFEVSSISINNYELYLVYVVLLPKTCVIKKNIASYIYLKTPSYVKFIWCARYFSLLMLRLYRGVLQLTNSLEA